MADQSASRRNGADQSNSKRNRSRDSKVSAREAAARVREDLPELLGRRIDSVLGVEPDDDDGGWLVTVAVVELARVPNSTDVLGAYEVTLDSGGELTGYKRRRRYVRSQADED
jgi:hypothetical protein